MGCNSDYMAANRKEVELSKVACLIDELHGSEIDPTHWRGYHPRVYCMKVDGDALVNELCTALQNADVSKYSLEMQMWWRDHQAADKQRLLKEMESAKHAEDVEAALAKLTPYERELIKSASR